MVEMEAAVLKKEMEEAEEAALKTTAVSLLQQRFGSSIPSLHTSPPAYCGVGKHVFSHRIHQLVVCHAVVAESGVQRIDDFEWWSPQRIQEAGTTSWLLLVIPSRWTDA